MVNPDQVVFLFNTIKEDDPLFSDAVLDCSEMLPQTDVPAGIPGMKCSSARDVERSLNWSKAERFWSPASK